MSERAIIEAAWSAVISTVAKGDASGAATAVGGAVAVGLLQTAGPAARLAVHHGVAGSDASTASLIAALRERHWTGDSELIELLTAAATGAGTGRGRLEVDLDGLGDVLGDQRGGYLDLTTGTAWPLELIELGQVDDLDPDDDPDDDPDRWLDIPGEGSRDAWRDRADFTRELTDAGHPSSFVAPQPSGARAKIRPRPRCPVPPLWPRLRARADAEVADVPLLSGAPLRCLGRGRRIPMGSMPTSRRPGAGAEADLAIAVAPLTPTWPSRPHP